MFFMLIVHTTHFYFQLIYDSYYLFFTLFIKCNIPFRQTDIITYLIDFLGQLKPLPIDSVLNSVFRLIALMSDLITVFIFFFILIFNIFNRIIIYKVFVALILFLNHSLLFKPIGNTHW